VRLLPLLSEIFTSVVSEIVTSVEWDCYLCRGSEYSSLSHPQESKDTPWTEAILGQEEDYLLCFCWVCAEELWTKKKQKQIKYSIV
jgi:hypothetical protein